MKAIPVPSRPRVGLIVEGWPAHSWQVRLLDDLAVLAEVSVFALPRSSNGSDAWRSLSASVPNLRFLESHRHVRRVADAQAALAACRAADLDLDLVVDVTTAPVATEPNAFRRGVWSLRQTDGQAVGAPHAFLKDIASLEPYPEIALVCDGDKLLRSVHPQVVRGQYVAGLDRLLGLAAQMPAAMLRMGGERTRAWSPGAPARARSPAAALRYATWLKARDRWRAWTVSDAWMLGIIDKPIQLVSSADLKIGVRWIGPGGRSRYWADPFGLPDDPTRLLCEEVAYRAPTGILKELTLDGDRVTAERPVPMSVSGHLSYPYLFTWEGATYCVPESGAAGKVVLHRQASTGGEWEPVCTVLDGVEAGDATLFAHGGLLWIAYSDARFGLHESLCLAWAERIAGPWHRHPCNPVKIDVRSARPGGTPFIRGDGHLIRPGQDCSRTYGGAVALNRIDLCTPEAYAEETIGFIRASPGMRNPHGVHTLSAWGERTLVDAKREWVNPWVIHYKIRKRLGLVREPGSGET